jgi:hypothetical protein
MRFLRFILLFASATIIAAFIGYTVDQFCVLWAHIDPNSAWCLGAAVWAAVLLVLMSVMGRQARDYR